MIYALWRPCVQSPLPRTADESTNQSTAIATSFSTNRPQIPRSRCRRRAAGLLSIFQARARRVRARFPRLAANAE